MYSISKQVVLCSQLNVHRERQEVEFSRKAQRFPEGFPEDFRKAALGDIYHLFFEKGQQRFEEGKRHQQQPQLTISRVLSTVSTDVNESPLTNSMATHLAIQSTSESLSSVLPTALSHSSASVLPLPLSSEAAILEFKGVKLERQIKKEQKRFVWTESSKVRFAALCEFLPRLLTTIF